MARAWMKTAREESGKTMAIVAKELNISESYYCEIENNRRMKKLDLHLAIDLSKILDIPVMTILDEESKVDDGQHCFVASSQ